MVAPLALVVVPVVRVGIVLVGVAKRLVGVHVPMAECRVIHPVMVMQVVLVMRVPVVVADGEMGVRMPVPLGQVQPHPDGHE